MEDHTPHDNQCGHAPVSEADHANRATHGQAMPAGTRIPPSMMTKRSISTASTPGIAPLCSRLL